LYSKLQLYKRVSCHHDCVVVGYLNLSNQSLSITTKIVSLIIAHDASFSVTYNKSVVFLE
jgi:hypothetical protein